MNKIIFEPQFLKKIVNDEVDKRVKTKDTYDSDITDAHKIICELSHKIMTIRKQALEIQQWFPYIKRNQIERLMDIIDGKNEHSVVSRKQIFQSKIH